MQRKMDLKEHDCAVPVQFRKEQIVNEYIDAGLFIETRRALKRLTMLSGQHPYCAMFYRSTAAKRMEDERHLLTHPNMIHPFSLFTLYWDFFMFFVYFTMFAMIPIYLAVSINTPFGVTWYIMPCVNFFNVIDIVVIFFSGYYDCDKNKAVLSPSKVALQYLKTYLVFDVISASPFFVNVYYMLISSKEPPYFVTLIRFLYLLKIVRCITFLEIFWQIKLFFHIPSYVYMGLRILFTYGMVWIWSCALMYCITNWDGVRDMDTMEDFIEYFYAATLVFLVVGYGNNSNMDVREMASHIFFMCLGFAFRMYLFSKVLQMWDRYTSVTSKNYKVNKEMHEYIKFKALPVPLRKRIIGYFDFKYQKRFYKDRKVAALFSNQLRQEIDLAVYQGYLAKLEIFYEIPIEVQVKILSTLQTEIYLPNDVIIRAGQEGTCMYIVLTGTVAVYSAAGKEICHMEDGAHFGEIALVVSHKRIATVIAVTACELFILKRDDFLRILEPYPVLRQNVFQTAAERYLETSRIDLSS